MVVSYEYGEMLDLVVVVDEVRLSGETDEEKEAALREWVARVGGEVEDWMVRAVIGPRVYLTGEAEVEVMGVTED